MVARHEDKNVSPSNASLREKKLLQIRGDLQGLLCNDNWSAVDAMLRGVKYADTDLLVLLIIWKNKWQQSEPTLLHDVLVLPSSDPPMALLQMMVATAPQVLLMEDASGNLPLHAAIYSSNQGKSLEIIKFLVKADGNQTSLTPITFWQAIRRGEEPVVRFLLQYRSCAKALVIPVKGRVPLYFVSKNTHEISPLLRLLLEATCDVRNKQWCCLYAAIQYCSKYLYDASAILEIAQTQKLYCINHLVHVAGEKNCKKLFNDKQVKRDYQMKLQGNIQEEHVPSEQNGQSSKHQDKNHAAAKQDEDQEGGQINKQSNHQNDSIKGEQNGQSSKHQDKDHDAAKQDEPSDKPLKDDQEGDESNKQSNHQEENVKGEQNGQSSKLQDKDDDAAKQDETSDKPLKDGAIHI